MKYRIDTMLALAASQLAACIPPACDTAHLDAALLMSFTLKKNRNYLFTWPETILSDQEFAKFQKLIKQRASGLPVAYLIGEKEFWNLNLKVSKHVLIPRPDTELIVELALSKTLPADAIVADLGTGSGAIALAMARERPNWQVYAIDISLEALNIAKENASINNISNVSFLAGSWCQPLKAQLCHMIVSNPPYIREDDHHLKNGDIRFEPLIALASGKDGLKDIRQIICQSALHLIPGGCLLVEHSYDHGETASKLMAKHGYKNITTNMDLAGHDRVSMGNI
ncbi:MAG: peptide chain release factor N(5)-glutamine methyltransferase [Candidatus Endonucleobacter bathymodioli]|uniref:Release factor glutamine methyltransferase n=1 Tax=Candidatus Endonucleibacter bathymodioli TaxID=539814 RepID=A0AA90SXH4_9GAMM|nr:peptide chain release factor N(5)-glutamine methyltransferase [Candidatus Endonucleobacter bathymodioli]